MSLSLTAEQERALREAIVAAFSPGDLGIAVHDYLGDELHNLVAAGSFPQQVYGLIAACRQRGWLDRLVRGVIAERGEHPRVIDLARRIGLHPAGAPGGFEKLVGANHALVDLYPWLYRCSAAAARVCQVRLGGERLGSGLLVGPDAVLTCHHVVAPALDRPGELAFVFDYAHAVTGGVYAGTAVAGRAVLAASPPGPDGQLGDPMTAIPADDELDFALIGLAEPAGSQGLGAARGGRSRGWIALSPEPHGFAAARGLAILQHPLGDPVKLALDFAASGALVASGRRVRYAVPTQPGSSGSPVLAAASLRLVALHHGGAPAFNQGVPTALIARHPEVAGYLAALPPQ